MSNYGVPEEGAAAGAPWEPGSLVEAAVGVVQVLSCCPLAKSLRRFLVVKAAGEA
jgi:hypothetical protein